MNKTEEHAYHVRKVRRFSHDPQPGYVIKGRVWLEKDGELYLGWGRIKLLENIDKFGSIASAAQAMGLGYRNAWLWVQAMNRLAPSPLIEVVTGGTGGSHAKLTDEGHKAVAEYKQLHEKLQEALK
ncbi:MAG: LysR family transcriptional regulator [Dehalococcoidales bacterium]|nr:LysR family transcriptional regulator [Dehalococcoidales bacterium]